MNDISIMFLAFLLYDKNQILQDPKNFLINLNFIISYQVSVTTYDNVTVPSGKQGRFIKRGEK